jgi:hypothetical protein
MKPVVWICVILSILIMIFVYVNWFYKPSKGTNQPTSTSSETTELAKKLNQNGWTMYGSDKCKFCRKQKDELADGFSQINYVDCETNPSKCSELGNVGIPFWKCSDGRTMNGYQTLSQLNSNA